MNDLISKSALLEEVDKIIDGCASFKAWAIRNAIDEALIVKTEGDNAEDEERTL